MGKSIPAAAMKRDIPVVIAAAVAAVEAVDPITRSQAAMWARPAVLITKVPLMTVHSLILLMTVENHWNLSVAQAR